MNHAAKKKWFGISLSFITVVTLFATLCAGHARAEVVVLGNHTASSVSATLLPTGEPSRSISIPAGDSRCVFYQGSIDIRFGEGFVKQSYPLQTGCAYLFDQRIQDGSLMLEQIGLGEGPSASPPPPLPGTAEKFSEEATIEVKILVDDDEPTFRSAWEPRIRDRIEAASKIFQRHCGISLKVVAVDSWDSDDAQHDFFRSLGEFEREVFAKPGQVAIGFSSQYRITRGRTHMGGTRGPLHSHILLKERSPQVRETERLELLVHELGHYLAASHSPEPTSVMRPVLTGGLQRRLGAHIQFDPVNTLLMGLLADEIRNRNVRRLAEVRSSTKRRMRQIYQVLRTAMPEDPAAGIYLQLLGRSTLSRGR